MVQQVGFPGPIHFEDDDQSEDALSFTDQQIYVLAALGIVIALGFVFIVRSNQKLKSKVGYYRNINESNQTYLNQMLQKNHSLFNQIENYRSQLSREKGTVKQLSAEKRSLEEKCGLIEAEVSKKKFLIDKLQQEVVVLKSQIQGSGVAQESTNKMMGFLESELNNKVQKIEELNAKIELHNKKIAALQNSKEVVAQTAKELLVKLALITTTS